MDNPLLRKLAFIAIAAAIGIVTAFSMAPYSLWPLALLGIGALYVLHSRAMTGGQAFAAGFFFALGYFTTGLWWIGNALLVEGNEFKWVWPISVIGLPTLLALFTGTYLGVARMISCPNKPYGVFVFALLLTFSEWARGHAFTGFPWNLYGYTWADTLPMAQGFYFLGAYGVTLLTITCAAILGFAALQKEQPWQRRIKGPLGAVFVLALLYGWGHARLENNPTKFNGEAGVIVVQPNIAQTMKWDPSATEPNFLKTVSLSENADFGDIKPKSVFIVWPETAIGPSIYMQTKHVDRMQQMMRVHPSDAYLITGILRRDDTQNPPTYSNSVAFLNEDMTALSLYSKFHLVPFGEFIPFQKYIPLKPVASFNGFERGPGAATIGRVNVPPFSPLVCYEVIFPDDVVFKYGNVRPQWIVNVTNDGWYGDSAGPRQHFAQTRLRAIEEGLPVIRSANTGISGVIDSYGRIVEKADFNQEASLISLLPRPLDKPSLFWPWAMQPLLFLASFALMIAGLCRLRHCKN